LSHRYRHDPEYGARQRKQYSITICEKIFQDVDLSILDLSKSSEYCVYYGGWRLSFEPGCKIVPVQTGRRIG